jgi:hypothetical protein
LSAGRRKALVHAVFGAVGLVAVVLLVRGVGAATLLHILRSSARLLPLLFAIETLRVVVEAAGTWSLSARVRDRVPVSELFRVHLIGYAVNAFMPAGRATAEAVKAAMLSRFVGVAEGAAVGAANQMAVLLGGALSVIPSLGAAFWVAGWSPLTGAIAGFAGFSLVAFAALQIACRRGGLGGALLRRFGRLEAATAAFQGALGRIPVAPVGATMAAVGSRLLAVVELGILLAALGGKHGIVHAFLAHGVGSVGGTMGDLVPGQLGASDGAFALAAPYLGLALADGLAISVMLHCVQALWAVIGWTVPFVWKAPVDVRAPDHPTETGAQPALPPREPA